MQCVEWLLRHRLITQVHYYYYLLLPDDDQNNYQKEYKEARLSRPRTHLVRLLSVLSPLREYQIIFFFLET